MRIPKIYLETTIFNFYFADDALDKKQDTLKLFEEINEGKYIPFTSAYVIEELEKASLEKSDKMLALIKKYNVTVLDLNTEAVDLARKYVDNGIIPTKYITDGLHISTATVYDLDYIISYNFQHIVKLKTIVMTEAINLAQGYKKVGIFSPTEVVEYEDD